MVFSCEQGATAQKKVASATTEAADTYKTVQQSSARQLERSLNSRAGALDDEDDER